jgi:ATP-dependent DNA helicase RecG
MMRGRSTEADPDQQRLAERRLATMVQTTDGFRIAEVDLELRGPGDYFGTRQSGMPAFSVANIVTDGALLEVARRDAFTVVEDDPQLRRDDHQMLARHLRTFFREELELLHVG